RALVDASLPEVAAFQWRAANEAILEALAGLTAEDWCATSYADFLADPAREVARLCAFVGLELPADLRRSLRGPLPIARHTLSPPAPDKWRRYQGVLAPLLSEADALHDRITTLAAVTAVGGGPAPA